jgi:hypothetical protein
MEIIKKQPFAKEKDLQILIERNLDKIFGISFLESEYPIPNGRIDTLGLDGNGTPVVIEFKKKQDSGNAIIQGLFYINWVKRNKRAFEMLVREKLGNNTKVDWASNIRLIIIAETFDQKEISAVPQIIPNVELKKYSFHGDMISLEEITLSKVPQPTIRGVEERKEVEIPTLEEQLDRAAPKIREAFLDIRGRIFQIGQDIEEKITGKMICYYSGGKGMAWFDLGGKRLELHLRKGIYADKHNKIKPEGWGGYPVLRLRENELDIEYLIDLLRQAYDKE